MVETINVITEPLEPFLYTKQWLSKSPLPPKTLKSRIARTSNSSEQQQFHQTVKNHDIQLNNSQPKGFKETSFKEQVSGKFFLIFFIYIQRCQLLLFFIDFLYLIRYLRATFELYNDFIIINS